MPELTEVTNEAAVKIEETQARIEDEEDEDSDTTIPELEDTGKQRIEPPLSWWLTESFADRKHSRSAWQGNRRPARLGVEGEAVARREEGPQDNVEIGT